MIKKLLSIICASSLVFSLHSCQDRLEEEDTYKIPLNISLDGVGQQSRGPLANNSFSPGDSIGLCVVDGSDTKYENMDYSNVKFSASFDEEEGELVWNAENDIMLSGTGGTLYAYYPYGKDIDIKQIPVDMSTQTDWLYAERIDDISNVNYTQTIVMHHALANIKLNMVKDNYIGKGELSQVIVKSGGLAQKAVLNARTGELSSISMVGAPVAVDTDITISSTPSQVDVLVLPTTEKAPVEIAAVVDSKTYKIESDEVNIESGNSYCFNVLHTAEGLKITSVQITPWVNNDQDEDLTLIKPLK